MQIDFNQVRRSIYIDELENLKSYASDIIDMYGQNIKKCKNELEEQYQLKNRDVSDDYEFEMNLSDFQYQNCWYDLRYYNSLSALYQLLYSIYENQAVEYFDLGNNKKASKIISNKTDDIHELYLLINVLKHGKGASYDELRKLYDRYFETSFPNIVRGIYSGEVLNISLSNLVGHCNHIIDFWKNEE